MGIPGKYVASLLFKERKNKIFSFENEETNDGNTNSGNEVVNRRH